MKKLILKLFALVLLLGLLNVGETNSFFTAQNTLGSSNLSSGCWVPPSVPVLTSPLNNTIAGANSAWNLNPLMDWQDSTAGCSLSTFIKYQYESYRNVSLTTLAYRSGLLATSQIPAPGTSEGDYWWRVKACDSFNHCSNWSLPWKLTVDRTAPASPTSLQWKKTDGTIIACGGSTNNYSMIADWNDVGDKYEYFITYPKLDGTTGTWSTFVNPSQYSGVFNAGEGIHTYKVRAYDTAGNISGWSGDCSINYDKTPPPAPLFWLEEDATSIKIDWQSSTGATGYKIYRSTDNVTYNLLTTLGAVTTYDDSSLSLNTDYHYKVTALDDLGNENDISLINGKFAGTMDIVIDDDSMNTDYLSSGTVTKTGSWDAYSINNVPSVLQNTVGGDNWSTNISPSGQTFSWYTNTPLTGYYEIFAQYVCDPARNIATYSVYGDSNLLGSGAIDQRKLADQTTNCGPQDTSGVVGPKWVKIGGYLFANQQGIVTLNAGLSPGYILADAIGLKKITDDVRPTSTITTPANSGLGHTIPVVNTTTVDWNGVIAGTASDAATGVNRVELSIYRSDTNQYWNGSAWISGTETTTRVTAIGATTWIYTLSDHPTGVTYVITSHAVDNAGNIENSYVLVLENQATPVQPVVTLTLSEDKKTVSFKAENIFGYQTLDYEIQYSAYETEKGIIGSGVDITGQSEYEKKDLDLATCSAGDCTYDQEVGNFKITITLKDKDGKGITIESKL